MCLVSDSKSLSHSYDSESQILHNSYKKMKKQHAEIYEMQDWSKATRFKQVGTGEIEILSTEEDLKANERTKANEYFTCRTSLGRSLRRGLNLRL